MGKQRRTVAMKLLSLFVCAVAALAIAHDTATLDEAIELVQEHTLHEAGAKMGAAVAVDHAPKTKMAVSSKAHAKKSKSAASVAKKVEARSTVMIGTHELDATKVAVAQKQLNRITRKIGLRHPKFLGEAAQIQSMASHGAEAGYVAGGYARLKTILEKVDAFELELIV